MKYSVSFDLVQKQLNEYYMATGRRTNYPEISQVLFNKGLVSEHTDTIRHTALHDTLSDDDFIALISNRKLPIYTLSEYSRPEVRENSIFPSDYDVYLLRHFYNISSELHTHDYFEIVYVFRGECKLEFEKKTRELQEGELCIIAPNSLHSLEVATQDSVVINILIRKSTFNTTFFSLLSRNDLLSNFFRTTLFGEASANYQLFYTENTNEIKSILKIAFLNSIINDDYSNACCVSMINMLFSTLLRNYSKTIQFYDYRMGTDFSLILQYIQKNFKHLTLSELAKIFHYNESYLSVLIKKNTNHSFSELIIKLKLSNAMKYLMNSSMKIAEIAEVTGYRSADHFSRSFRQRYGVSPLQYREAHLGERE